MRTASPASGSRHCRFRSDEGNQLQQPFPPAWYCRSASNSSLERKQCSATRPRLREPPVTLILEVAAGILLARLVTALLEFWVETSANATKAKWDRVHAKQVRREAAYALVAAVKRMPWGEVNSDATALAWWESQRKSNEGDGEEWWSRPHTRDEQEQAGEAWCEMQRALTAEADEARSAKWQEQHLLESALFDEEIQSEGFAFFSGKGEEMANENDLVRARRREHGLSNAELEWARFLVDSKDHSAKWALLSEEERGARMAKEHADSIDPVAIAKHEARIAERDGGRGYGDGGPFRLPLPSPEEEAYRLAYEAWHALGGNPEK
jgi:hypothetical protein